VAGPEHLDMAAVVEAWEGDVAACQDEHSKGSLGVVTGERRCQDCGPDRRDVELDEMEREKCGGVCYPETEHRAQQIDHQSPPTVFDGLGGRIAPSLLAFVEDWGLSRGLACFLVT
jgi:hypothetical protein